MPPKRKALQELHGSNKQRITAFFKASVNGADDPEATENAAATAATTTVTTTLVGAASAAASVEVSVTVATSPPAAPCVSTSPPAPSPLPVAEQLLVTRATPAALAAFCALVRDGTSVKSSNQSLPPAVRELTDGDLLFPQALPHGHCHALYTRSRSGTGVTEALKLTEAGSNSDSPRTNLLQGVSGKVYIYHVIAAHQAHVSPSPSLNPQLLAAVSQSKQSSNPMTILHLCGHKWCLSPGHLAVGSKRLNDEQTYCHRGLQSAGTGEELGLVEGLYCKHPVRCWSIVYGGAFRDSHLWSS